MYDLYNEYTTKPIVSEVFLQIYVVELITISILLVKIMKAMFPYKDSHQIDWIHSLYAS